MPRTLIYTRSVDTPALRTSHEPSIRTTPTCYLEKNCMFFCDSVREEDTRKHLEHPSWTVRLYNCSMSSCDACLNSNGRSRGDLPTVAWHPVPEQHVDLRELRQGPGNSHVPCTLPPDDLSHLWFLYRTGASAMGTWSAAQPRRLTQTSRREQMVSLSKRFAFEKGQSNSSWLKLWRIGKK